MLKVKPFLFILFLTLFATLLVTGCSESDSSSSTGGGNSDIDDSNVSSSITPIDLEGDPFSLLGVYNVKLYGINSNPEKTPSSKSELRVGLNLITSEGGMEAPEVLMSLEFEGKKIIFDKYIIDLSKLADYGGDLNAFISATFQNLGAELIDGSQYGLYFTLDPQANSHYTPIIDNDIIKEGEYLKILLEKTADIDMDNGLEPSKPSDTDIPEDETGVKVESVEINNKPERVIHGDFFQLTAEVMPNTVENKKVTWSSSHPNYVTVDNQGSVNVKEYTTDLITITATSQQDKTQKGTYSFTMEKATITGLEVSPSTLTLVLSRDGSTVTGTLTSVIAPSIATDYADLSYTSSNTSIATVDNKGTVTALKAGSTTITVRTGSISKTVNVTVENAPTTEVAVTGISISNGSKVYKKGDTIKVTFTLTPNNTTDRQVTYSTPSGQTGTITAVSGTGEITLANVQTSELLTVKTVKNQTATYNLQVVDEIKSVSFTNTDTLVVDQNGKITNKINDSAFSSSYSSITYESLNSDIATVDNNGIVTGNKNGLATIKATVQPEYDSEPLTATYNVDVLGFIDYTDENSLQGTYNITFFGTNVNNNPKTVISSDCSLYPDFNWNNTYSCGGGTGGYAIPNGDFAGRAIIKLENGNFVVHTKVAFVGSTTIQSMSKNDQYQYTVYDSRTLNGMLDTNATGNMDGRTLTAKSTISNAKYYFEKDASFTGKTNLDIVLFSHFDGKKAVIYTLNPDTRLVLRKVSSQVIPMDPNSLTEEPFASTINGRLSLTSAGNITVD